VQAVAITANVQRVHIAVAADGELASIPWEMAETEPINQTSRSAAPLILDPSIRVHRMPSRLAPRRHAGQMRLAPDHLRVLVVWADPKMGFPSLAEAAMESSSIVRTIQQSYDCRRIDTREIREASIEALYSALAEFKPDVLHFIGQCDNACGLSEPALIMHSASGPAWLTAGELKRAPGMENVRLSVLSACSSAGFGTELAESGSAVIAMQAPWRDAAAPAFARALYASLTSGCSLTDAVNCGRNVFASNVIDRAVPVLICTNETANTPWMAASPGMHNLPYAPGAYFEGRTADISRLDAALHAGRGTQLLICGLTGLGKSQLASEYAHISLAKYPGGVFWIRAADPDSLRASFSEIADMIGIPDAEADRAKEALRALNTTSVKTLLVYDNLTETTASCDDWFPTSHYCDVIATARKAYALVPKFKLLELEPLDLTASRTLLQCLHAAEGDDEIHAAGEIAKLLGGIPLGLSLAAHHIARLQLSFEAYLQRVTAKPISTLGSARKLYTGTTGHDGALFDILGISVASVSTAAKRLLLAASCFAEEPIPVDLLVSAAGLPRKADAHELIAELRDERILRRSRSETVAMHDLVRLYVRTVTPANSFRSAVKRAATAVEKALRAYVDGAQWKQAYALTPHAREVATQCHSLGLLKPYTDILTLSGKARFQMADYESAIEDYEQVLDLEETLSPEMRAETLRHLGDVHLAKSGSKSQARFYFNAAYEVAKTGLPAGHMLVLQSLNSLAVIDKLDGKSDQAIAQYRFILSELANRPDPDERFEGTIQNNLGNALETCGLLEDAIRCFDRAISVEKAGDRCDSAALSASYDSRGRCLHALRRFDEAEYSHMRALQLNRDALGEDHPYCAASCFYLGEVYAAQGRVALALDHYRSSLEIYLLWLPEDHSRPQRVRERIRDVQKQNLDTAG
jgi:tetratricopeptide (TPR) repeat protein